MFIDKDWVVCKKMVEGLWVVCGLDWNFGNEDRGEGYVGIVVKDNGD